VRKTPLFESHQSLGAKFTEFGGWEMPVRYSGLSEEHHCVRDHVGLFDVSHMGEIFVTGEKAFEFLQYVTTNDLSTISVGQAQYALLCNEQGGVVDDIISYFISENQYLLCVNASNAQKDYEWLISQKEKLNFSSLEISNLSDSYGQIAVQGPKARALVSEVFDSEIFPGQTEISKLEPFHFSYQQTTGEPFSLLIASTGYTGEDGFEIFCLAEETPRIWEQLLEKGAKHSVQPIGLGARDTLRLEVAYPLHGHELRDDLIALSSNVSWTIKFDKGSFVGKEALEASKKVGIENRLIGFEIEDRGIAREGAKILDEKANEIGWVSSGTMTPTVGRAIGLAFVNRKKFAESEEILAEVRGKHLKLRHVKLPFYRREK
jgi:aminomethyltransferase